MVKSTPIKKSYSKTKKVVIGTPVITDWFVPLVEGNVNSRFDLISPIIQNTPVFDPVLPKLSPSVLKCNALFLNSIGFSDKKMIKKW